MSNFGTYMLYNTQIAMMLSEIIMFSNAGKVTSGISVNAEVKQ